ncbi:MAG: hypothetical protein EOT05_00625 [Candidatus Microsaccharimonas sossegonensis]|uniref:Glycosyltransferase RgtA/B/C/D-like domain-containing protein n=1 Tax=Candidatus Microsaccharimonas sossegonensis TaxID=2506948 RepID=A0A4V1J7D0_9BACT|nr:MAG: hypothetical protein EOT05_00625 [Candidatus Microsaccharimonas sossegonensis]
MNTFRTWYEKRILTLLRRLLDALERYWIVVIIMAGLIVAAITFLIGIRQSVWFDEAYSLTLAKLSVNQLVALTSVDVHPPLYYLLLKVWGSLFGWNDGAYRALGALIGGVLVVVSALLVKRLFGRLMMLVVVPILVMAPFLIRYDFEIRMYALAALLGIIGTYILTLAVTVKRRQWLVWGIYALIVAISMYTVYYVALLWIAHVVWLVYWSRTHHQPIFRQPWLRAYTVAALLFLPWMPTFISQLTNGALAGIVQAMTIDNLVSIISFSFLYRPTWQLGAVGSFVMVVVLVGLTILSVTAYKASTQHEKRYLTLFVSILIIPIVVVALISLIRPFYVERYLVPILPAGYILTGLVIVIAARRRPMWASVGGIFLFGVLVAGVVQLAEVGNYNFQRLQIPTVNQAAASIGTCSSGDAILAADPYVATELQQYLPASCKLVFYDQSDVLRGGYAPLSNSNRQIKSLTDLNYLTTIHYVYYGQPQLSPMANFSVGSEKVYGALRIQTWQKR